MKARVNASGDTLARIRELEAGLLGCRQARSELEWECARLAQLANEATARAEKAEARVVELERMEEHWHNKALLLQRGERVGDETPSQGVRELEAD